MTRKIYMNWILLERQHEISVDPGNSRFEILFFKTQVSCADNDDGVVEIKKAP